ncbi:MAG: hypothetical protein OER04_12080, partial [Cyclobacteriaceae bacterium]|nr:hypothetical protein [Cyclobacteriaceae bacterium]
MKLSIAKKFLTLIVLCAYSQVFNLLGQELSFSHYTQESEVLQLPSAEIQSTYQDQFGYIWFVVYSSGLVRYNGHETVLFTEADGLPLLTVYELLEDPWGRLWVSTDAGLAVTEKPLGDYQLGEKPRFTNAVGDTHLATSAIVHNRMTIDGKGDLWVGTEEDGIIHYGLDSLNSIKVDTIHTDYYQKGVNRRVRSLLTLKSGAVWVALDDGDISVYPPGKYESSTILSDSASAPCQTEVLFETSSGEIWGGCWNGTLWKLKQSTDQLVFQTVSKDINNRLISLQEDVHGHLWAASYGSGVIQVEPSGSSRIYDQNNGLISSNINDIFLDREGNLWFAQSGGISKLRNNYQAFTNYSASTTAQGKPIFSNASLNAILRMRDHPDLIWTATTGGGITIILGDGSSVTLTKKDGLLSDRVTSLQEDQFGRIWAGTARGISCISVLKATAPPAQSTPWSFRNSTARIANYDNHSIYAVKKINIPVSVNSTLMVESLWFPGYQHLYCLVNEKWFVFRSASGLPSTYYHAITSDGTGKLWVGTRDRGVYSTEQAVTLEGLQESSGKPLPFEDNNQQVLAREVTDMIFRPVWNETLGAHSDNVETLLWLDNTLWVGSTSGLSAVEGNPLQSTKLLTEEAGLNANNITAMDYSKHTGTIWIGTNGGLAEIDPHARQVVGTVTKQNGLVDNEVWYYGSVFVDTLGNVLYGTAKGLSIYAPQHDTESPTTPLLHLEKASFTENNSGDNEVSFQYAALSFIAEKQIRYKTRLQGFDEDWSAITSENKIRYTNLPAFLIPRQYSFEVLGGYQDGQWTEEPLVHSFWVRPAWWLRWWSFLIQTVVAGFLIFWYVRFKTRNQARALAKEREITNRLKQIDKLKD